MRILLATDGSASAAEARDLLASLPWPERTTIRVLTAIDFRPVWLAQPTMASAELFANAEEAWRRDAEEDLRGFDERLQGRGWEIEHSTVTGRAATAILEAATEMDADLIVLGSRGRGRIASMLLGSVSDEVADRAACSVLVARGPSVTRVLVATDGTERTAGIPELLGGWGVLAGVEGLALSVTPVGSPALDLMINVYTLGSYAFDEEQRELRERSRVYAEEMATALTAAGIPSAAEVREGDAAQQIIEFAAEKGCDLVVTGSNALTGIDRLLLGSVARNVLLHSGASILIARPRKD
jgi:nucleotide-binding universal stress UspA family protein